MPQITLRQLLSNTPAKYQALVEHAYNFASAAHKDQKRASGEPYIIHPLSAAYFLSTLRLDGCAIAAALLHDVLEDTRVSLEEIVKTFGKEVAFLVDSVTKISALAYKGKADILQRQNIQAQTLRKMIFAMAKDLRVILIKLADRYHNVQTLGELDTERSQRIALETIEIYAPIAERLGMGHIKGELEDLSFPYAYPEEFKWLVEQIKEPRQERTEYLNSLIPKLKKIIENKGLKINDIHARAKHHYSLYKKMLTRDMDIGHIYDLIAVRIIMPDVESCYSALGIIHTYYKPLVGLIKDYIALPRPNGYQSLHTTVFCEEGKIVEIQLRTPKIHEFAENGIAAHWAYSESGKIKGAPALAQETQWVGKLRDLMKSSGSKEFIKDLKLDFFKHRIFVFTPKGDVIDLPEGATPLDAAYEIHTQLGNCTAGAKVNGKIASLSYELRNGDVVEILKSKNARPSIDWLMLVKTGGSKKKIKSWLAKNTRVSSKPAPQLALSPKSITKKQPIFKSVSAPIIVGGQEKISTHLARCCQPREPQNILGYITKQQRISIHNPACPLLKQREKARILPANWGTPAPLAVPIVIKVKDRVGMLKDISEIFAKLNINIKEIKNTPANGDTVDIQLILNIKDISQLEKSKEELTKTKDVISVQRVA